MLGEGDTRASLGVDLGFVEGDIDAMEVDCRNNASGRRGEVGDRTSNPITVGRRK